MAEIKNPYVQKFNSRSQKAFKQIAKRNKLALSPKSVTPVQDFNVDPNQITPRFTPAILNSNISSRIAETPSILSSAVRGGGGVGQGMKPAVLSDGQLQDTSLNSGLGINVNDSTGGNYRRLDLIKNMGLNDSSASEYRLQLAQAKAARRNNLSGNSGIFNGIVPKGGFGFQGTQNGQQQEGFFQQQGGTFDLSRAPIDAEQRKNAQQIINIGKQRGMNDADITIALMTALTESGLRNLNYGDRDSVGLFQQRTSQGWGSIQQIMNPNYSINKFFDAYAPVRGQALNPWMKAQTVQRSFDPTGTNYRNQYALAQRIMGSRSPVRAPIIKPMSNNIAGSNKPNAAQGFINQYNNKYLDFDGQYGAQCVDLFNYYNKGFVGGGFIGGVNGAKDMWSNRQMDQNYVRLNRSARPQMGDVAIWDGQYGGGFGHVAIVVGNNSNGTIRVLSANATPQGSRGNSVIHNIAPANLGYFRPKRLARQ